MCQDHQPVWPPPPGAYLSPPSPFPILNIFVVLANHHPHHPRVTSPFFLQGIFRVSGSQVEINNFREAFERGEDPTADMTDASDINSVAGVLKLYLRSPTDSLVLCLLLLLVLSLLLVISLLLVLSLLMLLPNALLLQGAS